MRDDYEQLADRLEIAGIQVADVLAAARGLPIETPSSGYVEPMATVRQTVPTTSTPKGARA